MASSVNAITTQGSPGTNAVGTVTFNPGDSTLNISNTTDTITIQTNFSGVSSLNSGAGGLNIKSTDGCLNIPNPDGNNDINVTAYSSNTNTSSLVAQNVSGAFAWAGAGGPPEVSTVAYAVGALIIYSSSTYVCVTAQPIGSPLPPNAGAWVAIGGGGGGTTNAITFPGFTSGSPNSPFDNTQVYNLGQVVVYPPLSNDLPGTQYIFMWSWTEPTVADDTSYIPLSATTNSNGWIILGTYNVENYDPAITPNPTPTQYVGPYQATVQYSPGDLVSYGGNPNGYFYLCNAVYTATGSQISPPSPAFVVVGSPLAISNAGLWVSGDNYLVNNIVKSPANSNYYLCITEVAGGVIDPSTDTANYQLFSVTSNASSIPQPVGYTVAFPNATPTDGQVLEADGTSGSLKWATAPVAGVPQPSAYPTVAFPATAPTNGQYLSADGVDGQLAWSSVAPGSGITSLTGGGGGSGTTTGASIGFSGTISNSYASSGGVVYTATDDAMSVAITTGGSVTSVIGDSGSVATNVNNLTLQVGTAGQTTVQTLSTGAITIPPPYAPPFVANTLTTFISPSNIASYPPGDTGGSFTVPMAYISPNILPTTGSPIYSLSANTAYLINYNLTLNDTGILRRYVATWVDTTTYLIGDVVAYGGTPPFLNLWTSLVSGNLNQLPDAPASAYWTQITPSVETPVGVYPASISFGFALYATNNTTWETTGINTGYTPIPIGTYTSTGGPDVYLTATDIKYTGTVMIKPNANSFLNIYFEVSPSWNPGTTSYTYDFPAGQNWVLSVSSATVSPTLDYTDNTTPSVFQIGAMGV